MRPAGRAQLLAKKRASGRKQRPPPDFETTASMGMRFELPFRNYVWAGGRTARAIYNWVPLDNESCRLEFMVQQGAEPSGPVSIVLRDGEPHVPSQDRVLLEAAQRLNWVEGDEKPYFKSVPSDQPAHFARNIMKIEEFIVKNEVSRMRSETAKN